MSERRPTVASPVGQTESSTRERARRAWRDIHEAVYYAATATRCVQYTDYADLRARRGDLSGDLDALQCMQQGNQLVGDAARRYQQLHDDFTAIICLVGDPNYADVIEEFVNAVQTLEEQLWALVPAEQLPVGMFAPVSVGTTDRLRLVRRTRRTGDLMM